MVWTVGVTRGLEKEWERGDEGMGELDMVRLDWTGGFGKVR